VDNLQATQLVVARPGQALHVDEPYPIVIDLGDIF